MEAGRLLGVEWLGRLAFWLGLVVLVDLVSLFLVGSSGRSVDLIDWLGGWWVA